MRVWQWIGLVVVGAAACGDDSGTMPVDGGRDAAASDGSRDDATVPPADAGQPPADGGMDATTMDAAIADAGMDAATMDAAVADAEMDATTTDGGTTPDAAAADGGRDAAPMPTVAPLYPVNGAGITDWVENDGSTMFDASDTACIASSVDLDVPDVCMQAGVLRQFPLASFADCSGVTIEDALGAFQWVCDETTGSPRAVSTGLMDDANLSDLIDFSGTPSFRNNSITATRGGDVIASPSSVWWTTPIVVDEDGGTLADDGTVYVVTTDVVADYRIRGDETAFLVAPGHVLTSEGRGFGEDHVDANSTKCLWIEGEFDSTGADIGIELIGGDFATLRSVTVRNAGFGKGINLASADQAVGYNVTATNNDDEGIWINARHTRFRNLVTENNDDDSDPDPRVAGIFLDGSGNRLENLSMLNDSFAVGNISTEENNVIRNVLVDGGRFVFDHMRFTLVEDVTVRGLPDTVSLDVGGSANRNVFRNIRVIGGGLDSMSHGIDTGSWNVFIQVAQHGGHSGMLVRRFSAVVGFVVSTNVRSGVDVGDGASLFSGLNRVNGTVDNASSSYGFHLDNPDMAVRNLATTGSTGAGIFLSSLADRMAFTGLLRVQEAPQDCSVSSGALPAPFTSDCVSNDAALTVIEGPVDTNLSGSPDFELSASDDLLRNVAPLPTGNDTVSLATGRTQTSCGDFFDNAQWVELGDVNLDHCRVTFLRDSYELPGDGVGNENGLCESNETCIYMPNIGAYQGHGALVPAGTIGTGGVIENVELLEYETNGV